MNPLLVAALIQNVAVPELTAWLRSLYTAGTPLDDAAVVQKLITDTNIGEQIGLAWLAAHSAP